MILTTNTDLVTFDTTEDSRIKVIDSDGNYIDYFENTEQGRSCADDLAYKLRNANNEIEMAAAVYNACDNILSMFVTPSDEMYQEIYNRYGKEYINRIGDCYLQVAE